MDLTFVNQTGAPMSEFAIQFNKNSFGISPVQPQLQVQLAKSQLSTAPAHPISRLYAATLS